MNQIDHKLKEVVFRTFVGFEGDVTEDLGPETVDAWDSMGHLNLIMNIQERFGVEFDFSEIMAVETIGDLRNILIGKIGDEE
jgi:acyl carrier protein